MPPHSPELLALLNACRAAPADDTPRLVLADWLDEHDDPDRAEFVRVQCELARPSLDAERVAALKHVETNLLLANWQRWSGDLPQIMAAIDVERARAERAAYFHQRFPDRPMPESLAIAKPAPIDPLARHKSWGFRRGLLWADVSGGLLSDSRFVAWCRRSQVVWLERVRSRLSTLDQLADLEVPDAIRPYLALAESLLLSHTDSGGMPPSALRRIVQLPNFGLVRELEVVIGDGGAGRWEILLAADLRHLSHLVVRGLTDERVQMLAAAPLDRLSALDIGDNPLGPASAAALAGSRTMPQLTSLSAWRTRLGNDGLVALIESPLAQALNHVELMNAGVGNRVAVALARSPLMARLYGPQLNLSMNRIGDAGAKALAECEHLARFGELLLRENAIGNAGAKALAASPFVRNLTYFDLWKNRVGDAGARALAASEYLDRVRDLSLRDNAITAGGASALCERFGDRAKV
jgi:uncharacterized protein (TIGR02996 family)